MTNPQMAVNSCRCWAELLAAPQLQTLIFQMLSKKQEGGPLCGLNETAHKYGA